MRSYADTFSPTIVIENFANFRTGNVASDAINLDLNYLDADLPAELMMDIHTKRQQSLYYPYFINITFEDDEENDSRPSVNTSQKKDPKAPKRTKVPKEESAPLASCDQKRYVFVLNLPSMLGGASVMVLLLLLRRYR
jgi:hypothetical protein